MFHANILVQNTLSNSKEFIIGLITDFFKKNNIAQKYLDRLVEQKYFDYYVFDGYQTKIKIEDIDKIMTIINQHTHEAIGYRFIIINNITNCTIQALNKLLKIIEEPHAHTYYFFTTSNLERVLYTIRSRCFTYFLKPVSNFNRMQELTNKQQMFVCKYINDCNQIIDIDNFNNN
jgi:DNA polymerase III delta prime subunit